MFGKDLNYRDEALVGEIKYLWELNRHDALVALAQAWHLTRDDRYAAGCRVLLESWFDQCPYPRGPNWTSALEQAMRLKDWAIAWHLLGEAETDAAFRRRWLESIYLHCRFIAGYLSKYSSANNHLLGELMGLFIASIVWPMWRESAKWARYSAEEFEREALKQNAEDGVHREQALWYQKEVAEMMLLVGLFGRENRIEFSRDYWERLERMIEFIAAIMDTAGNVPMIGDADDARIMPFADGYRSLLAAGSVIFTRKDFAEKAGSFDQASRWLLGDGAAVEFDGMASSGSDSPCPTPNEFPIGGYAVLGSRLGHGDEIRIVADSGPLGYLSIAAHGHADALSFTLSVAGHEMLVDPGTFAYHTNSEWREYFRGTSAHNTIRIDRVDQAVSGGPFLWTRHVRAKQEHFESGAERDVWAASHDGYLRLTDPVLHRRTIELEKRSRIIRVADCLECKGRHWVEIFWHTAQACEARLYERAVRLSNDGVEIDIEMVSSAWKPQLVRGQDVPPLGWISRHYDDKTPTTTILWSGEIYGPTELVTKISIGGSLSAQRERDES
jgi:hypothetical protein